MTTPNLSKYKELRHWMKLDCFVNEDLEITDNFQALDKAGIGNAQSAMTNERNDKPQGHTYNLINKTAA